MDPFKNSAKRAVAGGLTMIVLGFLAILVPSSFDIRFSTLEGWIIVVGGIAYFVYAVSAESDNEILFRLLIGFLYVFAGFYLMASQQLELRPLTYLVAAIVFAESLVEFIIFFQVRSVGGSAWILADAVATLILSLLIWKSPLASSAQGVGALIGIKFIVSGFTRIMYSLVALKNQKAIA